MLASLLVIEGCGAGVAGELATVEGLEHEAVKFFADVEIASAVWASVVPLAPLFDASATAELTAVLALRRLLDHH